MKESVRAARLSACARVHKDYVCTYMCIIPSSTCSLRAFICVCCVHMMRMCCVCCARLECVYATSKVCARCAQQQHLQQQWSDDDEQQALNINECCVRVCVCGTSDRRSRLGDASTIGGGMHPGRGVIGLCSSWRNPCGAQRRARRLAVSLCGCVLLCCALRNANHNAHSNAYLPITHHHHAP